MLNQSQVARLNRSKKPAGKAARPTLEVLESRTLLSISQLVADPSIVAIPDASASSIAGYSPAQIRNAYGFSNVTLSNGTPGTGAGQIIAIVDAYSDPNIASDLATFDRQYGLSAATLNVVSQTGSATALPTSDAGWALETSLDVEWATCHRAGRRHPIGGGQLREPHRSHRRRALRARRQGRDHRFHELGNK